MQVIKPRVKVLSTLLLLLAAAMLLPTSAHAMSPDVLISLTNQQRQAAGLGALAPNGALTASAQAKAADMFQNNYWAHFSPSGVGPWDFMSAAGYKYVAAGENLAKDFQSESDVMTGWMNSPGHRANILNPAYRDIGIAVQAGQLVGGETILVVAHYGATSNQPAPAPAPTPAPVAQTTAAPAATPVTTAATKQGSVKHASKRVAKKSPKKTATSHKQSFISKLFGLVNKANTQYGLYYGVFPRRLAV